MAAHSPYSYCEGDAINFIDLDRLEQNQMQAQVRTGSGFSQLTPTQGGSLYRKTNTGTYRLGTLPANGAGFGEK